MSASIAALPFDPAQSIDWSAWKSVVPSKTTGPTATVPDRTFGIRGLPAFGYTKAEIRAFIHPIDSAQTALSRSLSRSSVKPDFHKTMPGNVDDMDDISMQSSRGARPTYANSIAALGDSDEEATIEPKSVSQNELATVREALMSRENRDRETRWPSGLETVPALPAKHVVVRNVCLCPTYLKLFILYIQVWYI